MRKVLLRNAATVSVLLVVAFIFEACSMLQPLPKYRTSSTSFAPDQLPLAKRSTNDLVDPVVLGAYSALKEKSLRLNAEEDEQEYGIINRSLASLKIRDKAGIDASIMEREDESLAEGASPEEPPYEEAVIRQVVDRSMQNGEPDEIAEFNPAINRPALMKEIVNLLGVRYRYGGNDAVRGLDCSAFTGTIYSRAIGVRLPRSSAQQFGVGRKINRDELKVGDLVFFKTRRRRAPVSHVGIYVGDDMFAHASSRNGVIVSTLADGYYKRVYVGARRVLEAEFTDSRSRHVINSVGVQN